MSEVAWGTTRGRTVIAAASLGSGLTFLDSSVVNIALPAIGAELDASLAQLQWVVNGYLFALSALILLGGSLGDRFGRRRIFVLGTVWFAIASALCGLAPTAEALVAARVLQGVGGALLTPGSLAMIQGAFVPDDRSPAIGAWSGISGIATAIGPLVGGLLIDYVSWRWIFLINPPLAVLTVVLARWVPETCDPRAHGRFDVLGAVLASTALAALTIALIGWTDPLMPLAAAVAVVSAIAFLLRERRATEPMVPLWLFGNRTFSAANLMTLLVYGALGAITFFLVIELQTVSGWPALSAGLATLPITICLLLLAARGGALGQRIGPRIPMTFGPLVMAGGTLLLLTVGPDVVWWRDVLPGMTIFGLGLALMVAPLTATVLAAAPADHTGLASGINNAVARAGSLLAIAALPAVVGLGGDDYANAPVFDAAYSASLVICAALLVAGGAISWLMIPSRIPG